LVRKVLQPLQEVTSQMMDLLDIAPLLWIATHDLSGVQSAVKEQVGQALLALAWQQRL